MEAGKSTCKRKQKKVVPCSKSSRYFLTSLDRVLLSVWSFCNFIFSWVWLLRSVSLRAQRFTQWRKNIPLFHCHFHIFLLFSPFHISVFKTGANMNVLPWSHLEQASILTFSLQHNIPSKAAGCVLSLPQGKKVRENYVGPSHQAVLGSEITIWLNDPWFRPLKTRVNKSMEGGVLKKCCIHRGRLIIISFYLWFHWCFSSQTEVVCNFISHCIQIHKANLQCWENNLIFCQLFNDLTNFITGGAVWIIKDFSLPIIYRFEVWLSSSWKGSLTFQIYICKKKV